MKKNKLILAAIVSLSVCLSGCGDKTGPMSPEEAINYTKDTMSALSSQAESKNQQREALMKKTKVNIKEKPTYSLPNADIKLKAYSVFNWTTFGQPETQIYIHYDYTNTDERDSYPAMVDVIAYQDGARLTTAAYWHDNSTVMIKNGVTVETNTAFVLNNLKSDVQVKFESCGEESAEFTIKLK